MGIIKDVFSALNELITLGGASTLKSAQESYQENYKSYITSFNKLNEIQKKIDQHLENIGLYISEAERTLKKAEKVLKSSHDSQLSADQTPHLSLKLIDSFNTSYQGAARAGFGGLLGGSAAVGSWAVVSIIGSASTGTAIASLSGVAATNATLAWFGGGALAAGGAGMSGGMLVLGGILFLPIIYFSSKGAYKKAQKLTDEEESLLSEIKSIKVKIPAAYKRLSEISENENTIRTHCENFNAIINKSLPIIYPFQFFSRLKHIFFQIIKVQSYNEIQIQTIRLIESKTIVFLERFNSNKNNTR